MDPAPLELLQGILRKLESLDSKVTAVLATQAAQGQGLAEFQRVLDEMRLLMPAGTAQRAPAPAASGGAAAAAAPEQQAAEPLAEAQPAVDDDRALPDDSEMPDAAAEAPASAAEGHPAASHQAPRMQHAFGAAQQAGEGPLGMNPEAAAPPHGATASPGQSSRRQRRRLQPQRLSPPPQPPPAEESEGLADAEPVAAWHAPYQTVKSYRPDEVLKMHEDFIVAALPRRPPAPHRGRPPASLWQRASLEPPPEPAPAQQEQQEQQQQHQGPPPGWPSAFLIDSEEVCGLCHPSDFAQERRRWPATTRANCREMRRFMLGFKHRLRVERGDSESEDEAELAAHYGMQKGAAFDAEEEEDSELRQVLSIWSNAEMGEQLSFSGSEPSSEEEGEEEQEVALELEGDAEPAEMEDQGLEDIQEQVATLAAHRQELLQQLVAALGLNDAAAEAQAVTALQQQIAWRDEALNRGGGSLPLLLLDDPRQVLPSARKAAAGLEGLLLALQQQRERWQARKLPKLQQDAHRVWREGRMAGRGGTTNAQEWRADAAQYQERLLRQLLELLKTHLQSHTVSVNTVRKAGGIMELSYECLLERLELLRIAALPEQPAKFAALPAAAPPAARRQQQQQRQAPDGGEAAEQTPGAAGRQGGAAASGSEAASGSPGDNEGDEYAADSWLVEGDEEGGGGSGADAEMADAEEEDDGYASAAEELPSDSQGSASAAGREGGRQGQQQQQQQEQQKEREPAQRAHAWNAAGLLPGETKVLVSPANHTPRHPGTAVDAAGEQREQQREQREQQEQQHPEQQQQREQEEQQPAATEPLPAMTEPLPATQIVAGGAGEPAKAADDATSPAVEPGLDAVGIHQSPAPSAEAVDAAMARAGSIMGGSSTTAPGLLPPAPAVLQATATSPAKSAAVDEEQAQRADGAAATAAREEEQAQRADGAAAAAAAEQAQMADEAALAEPEEAAGAADEQGEKADQEHIEDDEAEPMSDDELQPTGLPGHLAKLAAMDPVEVLRTSDELGLHWERAYLQQPIGPAAQAASLLTVEEGGELVPFTCFALSSLRPALPVATAGSPAAAAAAAAPALTRAHIAVGDLLEFRVAADRSGQSAVYVPAKVVGAGVNAAPHHNSRRPRSIAAVLDRLHAKQGQQAQQQPAAEADARSEPDASVAAAPALELAFYVVWPGSRGSRRLVVTEQELAQDSAPLRRVCNWSAETGCWVVAEDPLAEWRRLGLSASEAERLQAAVEVRNFYADKRVADGLQRKLRELSQHSKALDVLQRWFRRHKLARHPNRSWRQTLRVLQLSGRQADIAARLQQAGADDGNFALARRNGRMLAGDPRAEGVRVPPRRLPAKKKKLLPELTPTKAQQRLAARERGRQALDGSQADAFQLIVDQVVEAAVGEAAEAIEARKLVPLWPDRPLEGQPQVYAKIWKHLKPHQKEGFQFIWNALELDFRQSPGIAAGCILAHHMGLGKTLQTVAFLSSYALLHPDEQFLVAVPKIVKGNWHAELLKWLPDLPASSPGLSKKKLLVLADSKEAASVVPKWRHTPSGVLIITHDLFSILVTGSKSRSRAKGQRSMSASGAQLEQLEVAAQQAQQAQPAEQAQQMEGPSIAEMLRDGPSVVVVDEAHVVKTDTARRSRALFSIKTRRRLALTGYPLQNNLSEMHAMISWADPDLISKKEWDREYAQPIMAGQLPDASAQEVRTMNQRLAVFHDLTSGVVHRCGEEILKRELPPKHEVVLKLALTPTQQEVYERYIKGTDEHDARSLFRDRPVLAMLCDRPTEFREWLKKEVTEGRAKAAAAAASTAIAAAGLAADGGAAAVAAAAATAASAAASAAVAVAEAAAVAAVAPEDPRPDPGFEMVLDDRTPTTSTGLSDAIAGTSGSVGAVAAASGQDGTVVEQPAASTAAINGPAAPQQGGLGALVAAAEAAAGLPADKLRKLLPLALAEELLQIVEAAPPGEFETRHTAKMWAIRQLLQHCARQGEKLVLVGESLELLRQIEAMLAEADLHLPGGRRLRWCKIEGETSDRNRSELVRAFEAGHYQVFLISKAGTHGINLVSCRRIVVLEEFFNPVYNLQAIARLFRYGQTQETFVYRMYHNGSIHYNCYLHSVNKVALFRRVVDRKELKVLRKAGGDDSAEKKLSYYLYAPDTPDEQSLQRAREQQSDPALAALVTADAEQAAANGGWRNIVVVEDHDKNLADDPSQRLSREERRRAAAQERRRLKLQAQQEAAAAAAAGPSDSRMMTRSMRAAERLKKRYKDLGFDSISDEEDDLSDGPAAQQAQQAQLHAAQRQQQVQQAQRALQQQLQFGAHARQTQQPSNSVSPLLALHLFNKLQQSQPHPQQQQQQQQSNHQQVQVEQQPPQLSEAEQAALLRAAQQQAAHGQPEPALPQVQVEAQARAQLTTSEHASLLAQLGAQQRVQADKEQPTPTVHVEVRPQPGAQQHAALMQQALAQQTAAQIVAQQREQGLRPSLQQQMALQRQLWQQRQEVLQRAAAYHGAATASQQARMQALAAQTAAAGASGTTQQQRPFAAAAAATDGAAAARAPQVQQQLSPAATAVAATTAKAAGAADLSGDGTPPGNKRSREQQHEAADGQPGGQQQKRARVENQAQQAHQDAQQAQQHEQQDVQQDMQQDEHEQTQQPVSSSAATGTVSSGQRKGKRTGLKALLGRIGQMGRTSHSQSLGTDNAGRSVQGSPPGSGHGDKLSPGRQRSPPAGQVEPANLQEQAHQRSSAKQTSEQQLPQQAEQGQQQLEQPDPAELVPTQPCDWEPTQAVPEPEPDPERQVQLPQPQPPPQAQEATSQLPASQLPGAAADDRHTHRQQRQQSPGRLPAAIQEAQHTDSEDSMLPGIRRRSAKRPRPPAGSNLRPMSPRASPRRPPAQPDPEVVDLTLEDD